MATYRKTAWLAVTGLLLPFMGSAQGIAGEMNGLHSVLEQLYDEMMPLCSQLIGVGQALAGICRHVVYRLQGLADIYQERNLSTFTRFFVPLSSGFVC